MKKGLFTLNWANIKSAIVYGLMAMFFAAIINFTDSVKDNGSIFGLDWHNIIDTTAMAVLGSFVSLVSVLKNLLTTDQGNFLGFVKVIPETKK